MSGHPYSNLPTQAYWKTAVGEIDPLDIRLDWKPKHPITRDSKILTLGSCFAQHIGKALREKGFNWIDAEPAPEHLASTEHAGNGYGIFSFRVGNVYTPALLKQWLQWAFDISPQSNEIWCDTQRYFDPVRPTIAPEGFDSAAQLLEARARTLEAMRQAFRNADTFVFTLGLTEAWLNRDGLVYAMCPGTARGKFDGDRHRFYNYTHQDVVRDLGETFDWLREVNPTLRFLLTVSPVPLTATASGTHVLQATTYSKSVLRAAAGHLCELRDDTDYFPSYELVTAPAFNGCWFDGNKRSVSRAGVAFVMRQFFAPLEPAGGAEAVPAFSAAPDRRKAESAVTKGDELCDEIILETWARHRRGRSEPPRLILLGDSQMGMLGTALEALEVPYVGGGIMSGLDWHDVGWSIHAQYGFNALPPGATARWNEALGRYLDLTPAERGDVCVLSNIGMHTEAFFCERVGLCGTDLVTRRGGAASFSPESIVTYLGRTRQRHVHLLEYLVRMGFRVIWISDPPVPTSLYFAGQPVLEAMLCQAIKQLGVDVFAAGEWIAQSGGFRPEYFSDDICPGHNVRDFNHGSPEYYRRLAQAVIDRFSIPVSPLRPSAEM